MPYTIPTTAYTLTTDDFGLLKSFIEQERRSTWSYSHVFRYKLTQEGPDIVLRTKSIPSGWDEDRNDCMLAIAQQLHSCGFALSPRELNSAFSPIPDPKGVKKFMAQLPEEAVPVVNELRISTKDPEFENALDKLRLRIRTSPDTPLNKSLAAHYTNTPQHDDAAARRSWTARTQNAEANAPASCIK